MSEAMEHMAGGYGLSSAPGAVPGFQSSPEHMTLAIRLVEEQEVLLDDQAIFQAVGLLWHDPSLATAYLAFGREGLRSKWLAPELAMDSAATASQLSLHSPSSLFFGQCQLCLGKDTGMSNTMCFWLGVC